MLIYERANQMEWALSIVPRTHAPPLSIYKLREKHFQTIAPLPKVLFTQNHDFEKYFKNLGIIKKHKSFKKRSVFNQILFSMTNCFFTFEFWVFEKKYFF